jgi:hypothetical protein
VKMHPDRCIKTETRPSQGAFVILFYLFCAPPHQELSEWSVQAHFQYQVFGAQAPAVQDSVTGVGQEECGVSGQSVVPLPRPFPYP